MIEIKEKMEQLGSNLPFERKYPAVLENDREKVNLLYVGPCLNASGYYRMIAPAMELNKTKTHRAIISQIHRWNFNKTQDEYDTLLDERLIQWADYILFPALFSDIRPVLEGVFAIKPNVQVVMDIDVHYFDFPDHHPGKKKYPKKVLDVFLRNLSAMDLITTPNKGLVKIVGKKLGEVYPEADPIIAYIPNLISSVAYGEIKEIHKNAGKKLRLGMITNPSQAEAIKPILSPLKAVLEKFEAELFVFGWNGMANGKNYFQDLPFKHVKSLSFLDYPNKLNRLALDVFINPIENHPFSIHGKTFVKYLEASAYGIPTISTALPPYTQIITHGENGFLASNEKEWKDALTKLLTSKPLRENIGREALKYVWKNWGFSYDNFRFYTDLFI